MSAGNNNQSRPVKILLVDDEEGFVQVLAKRLRKRQFDVMTAGNGPEAIKILRQQDVDIAVVDFKMEGLDGIEVLKVFKMMVPELPVMILTGHGCQAAAADGQRYGAADYLSKPYNFEDLVGKIQSIIGRRKQ
ncbi:MAG: response regulator [Desulfobacterales bacterium]|jgi:DNA-binding response OmpR family regulator|nr:response regulator [Desulfobacterales bacterium]